MSAKEKNTLEFEDQDKFSPQALKDEDAKKLMRRSFRIPISHDDQITAHVEGSGFRVLNVSKGGIGLLMDPSRDRFRKDSMENLSLYIEGKQGDVRVRVAHISPHDPKGFICGLEFVSMSRELEQILDDFLSRTRKKWLETR